MDNSEHDLEREIEETHLYNARHLAFHGYVMPFVVSYATWLYIWLFYLDGLDNFELGCIGIAAIGIVHILCCLFCYWFVSFRCFITCNKAKSIKAATLVKVIPTKHNGWPDIVPLSKRGTPDGDLEAVFVFQKTKFRYDPDRKQFLPPEYPLHGTVKFYLQSKGLQTDKEQEHARKIFGINDTTMNIPKFVDLFIERATAPFFVFQVFCVGLWCLDEYWYYSLVTLGMLILFECTLVQQQMRNMAEIRRMGNKPFSLQVYRNRHWISMMSDQLLPGDLVSIGRSKQDYLIPCDLLLLRGSCIVDESMLTGESIPVMKEPLDNREEHEHFSFDEHAKLHVLSGGTKIVQHTAPVKSSGNAIKMPDTNCLAYVIRSGFSTSQGRLLKTILFSVKQVTANNLETFCFILFLLIFAIAASAYVWIKGTEDPTRNRYKLMLECTLILTSVVPPELPIELSLAVNSSLLALTKLMIYCTEPFRIPFAGKVDICCFDKTGTLTKDEMIVEGISGLNSEGGSTFIQAVSECPLSTIQVLASCHSLAMLEDKTLIGDPLEKAILYAADYTLTRNDVVMSQAGGSQRRSHHPLKIYHRFHFSSALQRMSVIVGHTPQGSVETEYMACVKGSPEALKPMFIDAPADYDQTYIAMARRGARVLALGIKKLGKLSHDQVRGTKRQDVECQLTFCGFVIVSCPLKSQSKSAVNELLHSSHHVTMITGDSPLTACHVSKQLRIIRKEHTLILTNTNDLYDGWHWQSVDDSILLPIYVNETDETPKSSKACRKLLHELAHSHDLCITGDGLKHLQRFDSNCLRLLLPAVRVYARVAPKQKELVVTLLKQLDYVTLMCGDGTNDVGALKHAHVGVSLLAGDIPAKPGSAISSSTADNSNGSTSTNQSTNQKNLGGASPQGDSINLRLNNLNQRMAKSLQEMQLEEQAGQFVRLGDASIAAPFTAKMTSAESVCHILKQGRCTLVVTLQMFKILALNALVLAYSHSVLFLEGVKFSDSQATLQALLLAGCFLFITRSKPLQSLSKRRPLPNIFNTYTLLTVLLQFSVHFGSLYVLTHESQARMPAKNNTTTSFNATANATVLDSHLENNFTATASNSTVKQENSEFEPNLLNSVIYLMSVGLQTCTFAVNYKGRPFMESLGQNKPLLYSLIISFMSTFALALGLFPDINEQFQLVIIPNDMKLFVVEVLFIDLCASFAIDRILDFFFGKGRMKRVY
jgi:manganese-transporting P-type ATPase